MFIELHSFWIGEHEHVVLDQVFELEGFDALKDQYLKYWIHTNERLEIASSQSSAGTPVIIKGISKNGFLLAECETGELLELQADGNSIDLMQGLIHQQQWAFQVEDLQESMRNVFHEIYCNINHYFGHGVKCDWLVAVAGTKNCR